MEGASPTLFCTGAAGTLVCRAHVCALAVHLSCLGVSWCVLVCLGCSRVRRCMSSHARTPCVRVHTCARGVLYARTQARCSSTEHAAHAHTHTGKRCTRRTCCWISGKRLTRQASKAARHIPMSVFFPRSECQFFSAFRRPSLNECPIRGDSLRFAVCFPPRTKLLPQNSTNG